MKNIFIVYFSILFYPSFAQNDKSNLNETPTKISFSSSLISNEVNLWWARTFIDVDNDGIKDIVLQDNNGHGGWLGYLKGRTDGQIWQKIIIAEKSPNGNSFAAGDLEAGDMDGDGDIDIIGVEHPGEWANANATAWLFWYEQTKGGWVPHVIGSIPGALKDISIGDLNHDGIPEIITATYNSNTLSIFTSSNKPAFTKAWELKLHHLHEGLDTDDINGDGWVDIATNGYWLENPKSIDKPWSPSVIDSIWMNQSEKNWAKNATKIACKDIDGDGKAEVFISHSEKTGYPVAVYSFTANNTWQKEILLETLPAAHNMVVIDIDNDGEFEILTGVNKTRAKDIKVENFPVYILKKDGNQWLKNVISEDGSYNLLASDLEGDGDIDLIRLPTHDAKEMYLMKNELIKKKK
jgi:hypothetical protein